MLFYILLSIFVIGIQCKVTTIGPCLLVSLPEHCNSTFVNFILYNRHGPVEGEIVSINENNNNLTSSSYNSNLGNKVIIHGFNADHKLFALQDIKNEYLINGDNNVWMIDWSLLSKGPCYPGAVHNVRYVGYCLSIAIQLLRNNTGNLDLHVIGFSLGAHIPSVTATFLLPYIIPRVTGLDPALPGFFIADRKERLSNKSAAFVDIIHTNGMIQGLIEPLGHADFYMNGGIIQPGCSKGGLIDGLNCDHVRAPVYMAESINSNTGFWSYKCSPLYYLIKHCPKSGKPILAGEHVPHSTRGSYAVETNSEAPFARGK